MKKSEAMYLRGVIERAAQSLTDDVALTAITLHPEWAAGHTYVRDHKVRQGGKLWRCLQLHTSQVGWEPENAASLWAQICQTHSGTLEDPIPYEGGMALTNGLYYVQNGVAYLCTRDTVNPVYHALAELVGLYVEAALNL